MRTSTWFRAALLVAFSAAVGSALGGCGHSDETTAQSQGHSLLTLDVPPSLGKTERLPVVFDHELHTNVYGPTACRGCHTTDRHVELAARIFIPGPLTTRDDVMNEAHDLCLGCHRKRGRAGDSAGPTACGGCHDRQATQPARRVSARLDYSLHHRHDKAMESKCESCHHVYDEEKKALVYVKGEESPCTDCHGDTQSGNTPSFRHAVHDACVGCHVTQAKAGTKTGPTVCRGCHEKEAIAAIEVFEKPPLVDMEQPKQVNMNTLGAGTGVVPFNHEEHQRYGSSCSSCHHRTVNACSTCHAVRGKPEGRFVTLEQAHHNARNQSACVGCHQQNTKKPECAGCHEMLAAAPGASCAVCHRGEAKEDAVPPKLEALPAYSEAFPETVKIEGLKDLYGTSVLPHGQIVRKLDEMVRADRLAVSFHASVETLCNGCHHRTPRGVRPSACGSCHGASQDGARLGLKAAYHRQCVGCHERMQIKEIGCTDCHEKAAGEKKP